MLTIACFKWQGWRGNDYNRHHVHALQNMVKRHLNAEHRFVCITDNPAGLKCETYPLWPNPPGLDAETRGIPNCYKRLKLFADSTLGDRILALDLDSIITGQLDALIPSKGTGFKILQGTAAPYNGSMWYVEPGYRPDVWHDITQDALDDAQDAVQGYGSDQVWLSHKLPGAQTWGPDDGVYQYHRDGAPDDARVLFFAGAQKPWDMKCPLRTRWLAESAPV